MNESDVFLIEDGICILEDEINELVGIETNDGCHSDDVEDYESKLDYYLSNVIVDTYLEYLEDYFRLERNKILTEDLAYKIRNEVKTRIESNY